MYGNGGREMSLALVPLCPEIVQSQEGHFMSDMRSHADGPTVVLVHGSFADASSWAGVTERLEQAQVPVKAIVNPLRGIRADAAYVSSVMDQIPGPVLAVGHSYGGAVITNAASNADNVVGLVYVAAFAPDEGESVGDIVGASKDSMLLPAVQETKFPTGNGTEMSSEYSIDPAKFRDVFTADLSQEESDILAVSQRPTAAATLTEKTRSPAWKDLSSWAVVGTADKAIGTDQVRSMAQRAGADISELNGSHVVMISQPDAVTDVIMKALNALS
jgi:pimeloyl-ACP methyl ester carboxylesterase